MKLVSLRNGLGFTVLALAFSQGCSPELIRQQEEAPKDIEAAPRSEPVTINRPAAESPEAEAPASAESPIVQTAAPTPATPVVKKEIGLGDYVALQTESLVDPSSVENLPEGLGQQIAHITNPLFSSTQSTEVQTQVVEESFTGSASCQEKVKNDLLPPESAELCMYSSNSAPADCYLESQDYGLTLEQSLKLCKGATQHGQWVGPMSCFVSVSDLMISEDGSIELCENAQSPDPAVCFISKKSKNPELSEKEVVQDCLN